MGQQNDSLEPETILNQINSLEQTKKDNLFSEESFIIAKAAALEYIRCRTLLDIYKKNKNSKEKIDRNKLEEANHNFDRITKWIKMAKTPYVSNFQFFLGKIKGDDKKTKNKKLYQDKSTDNIFGKGFKKKRTKLNLNQGFSETDRKVKNNEEASNTKKNKRKKTTSLDKYKQKIQEPEITKEEEEEKNNNIIIQNFSDKNIEEKIREFYSHNKSKFKERLFKEPPECLRWVSWCIINQTPLERDINIYNNYLVKDLEEENKNSIIRDIQRTFTDTKNINKDELKKKEISLYNVLKAFWNLDDQIGYCQGMNLLVGFMLLISEGNELDTFYILISNMSATFNQRKIYDYSWRGLFSEGFPLLVYLNFIFDILFEENLSEIKNHLDELGITYDLWIGQWFQTLFTIVLPVNWCKRVWDCIFSDNIYFLVKFGIVFTKMLKNDILEKTEEIDVINFFKDLQKFSMCSENKFLEEKGDINVLITNASKIKLDPEQYFKLYRKRNEDFNEFRIEMNKNSGVLYPLETGNRAWNDFKINNRATILFEKEDKNDNDKEVISINQIKDLYGDEEEEKKEIKEKKEMKSKHIKRSEKINNNVIYDPNTKKIEIKINTNNSNDNGNNNKNEEKEIKIKPIFERKDRIKINDFEINKKIDIKEDKFIDDKNKESNDNEIKMNIPSKGGLYKKKKMDKLPLKKANKITESRICFDNNTNNHNINNNINNNVINNYQINNNIINNNIINNNIIPNQNNYNDLTNKYYNVNRDNDNANLDNYYKNKLKK